MTSRAQADATSDAILLRAHVDGDPQAFAELVRRHRDRLWAVALRTIGDREEAADAVQDALLAAHRNAARFRGESAVTTWLHRIVVNACLDRIRRRQSHPTVPLPDGSRPDDRPSGVEPAAPVQDHDTALVVREALAALPPDQRAAIVLVDVQGYPVAEAAEILGVAEGTIKSRCARGRARMAVSLGHLRTGAPANPKDTSAPAGPKHGSTPANRKHGSTPVNPKDSGARVGAIGSSAAVGSKGSRAQASSKESRPQIAPKDSGASPSPKDGDAAASPKNSGAQGGPNDSGAQGGPDADDSGASAETTGSGSPARARDTGHEADGNRDGARSVPSGPAAASGPRPGAHDRRDQR